MLDVIVMRNKFREELDERLTFESKLITNIEDIIFGMRDVSGKSSLSKDNFMMLTLALAKSCFVKYMIDLEPIIERGEKIPNKTGIISQKEWEEFVSSNDYIMLKNKLSGILKDQKKRYTDYLNTIKEDYKKKSIKLSDFMEILNDRLDDMSKVRLFLKNFGKNLVKNFKNTFVKSEKELRFVVKLIYVIEDIQKENLPVFDIALRSQFVETMQADDIEKTINKFLQAL